MQQTVDSVTESYTLDINNWLTQVLADGAHTYLYGNGRIAQYDAGGAEYFLGDALGSVRQLADAAGMVTLVNSYQPFGQVMQSVGASYTSYGFANEWMDGNGLIYLRARYYSPNIYQFIQPDSKAPNPNKPWEWNRYTYVRNNPVNLTDPSGMSPKEDKPGNEVARYIVRRMQKDSTGKVIKVIHDLNTTHFYLDPCKLYSQMTWWERYLFGGSKFITDKDLSSRVAASAWFGCLVAPAKYRPICGQWDYKKEIRDTWRTAQIVDFSVLGIDEEVTFYYDIWANFHFGYLGLTGGFSEETLLTGAAIEHFAQNYERGKKIIIQDDPSDFAANMIGFHMYKHHNLSERTLLWWIYIEKNKLNKAEVDEFGNAIRIYR